MRSSCWNLLKRVWAHREREWVKFNKSIYILLIPLFRKGGLGGI